MKYLPNWAFGFSKCPYPLAKEKFCLVVCPPLFGQGKFCLVMCPPLFGQGKVLLGNVPSGYTRNFLPMLYAVVIVNLK